MFCVVVCGYIISIIETEQFSKLSFLVLGLFFYSFLGFRTIVIANLGSFACNFSISGNHLRDMWEICGFSTFENIVAEKKKFI